MSESDLGGDFSLSDALPGQPERPKPQVILEVLIPGEPRGLPRHRSAAVMRGGKAVLGKGGRPVVRSYADPKARAWAAVAQSHMLAALEARGLPCPLVPAGPVAIYVQAVFTLARSHWRKRSPFGRQRHATRPDLDNVVKAALDAALGVLWLDDCQVAEVRAEKWVGAQGEAPFLLLRVEAIADELANLPTLEELRRVSVPVTDIEDAVR